MHTLFIHFFTVVLHDYDAKLPSYTFYGGNVVYVFLFTFFFTAGPFDNLTLVAAGISHILAAAIKLLHFFSNEIGLR